MWFCLERRWWFEVQHREESGGIALSFRHHRIVSSKSGFTNDPLCRCFVELCSLCTYISLRRVLLYLFCERNIYLFHKDLVTISVLKLIGARACEDGELTNTLVSHPILRPMARPTSGRQTSTSLLVLKLIRGLWLSGFSGISRLSETNFPSQCWREQPGLPPNLMCGQASTKKH